MVMSREVRCDICDAKVLARWTSYLRPLVVVVRPWQDGLEKRRLDMCRDCWNKMVACIRNEMEANDG